MAQDFKIVRKEKSVDFWYNNRIFTYKYVSESGSGFSYIYYGQTKIYGPYEYESTELGKEVYNAYWNHFIKNK